MFKLDSFPVAMSFNEVCQHQHNQVGEHTEPQNIHRVQKYPLSCIEPKTPPNPTTNTELSTYISLPFIHYPTRFSPIHPTPLPVPQHKQKKERKGSPRRCSRALL